MDLFVSIFKVLSPQVSRAVLASEVVALFQGRERHLSLSRHKNRKTIFFLIKRTQKLDSQEVKSPSWREELEENHIAKEPKKE